MTATKDITQEQRLTVIKHLAGGKSPDVVAAIVSLDRATIVDIGSHHGYPDTDKLKWAVDVLQGKIDADRAPEPSPTRPVTDAVRVTRPATSSPSSVTNPDTRPTSGPDDIRVLLNTAKAHPSKRIQKAADKVFDDIACLRNLIREDEEKHAEARKIAAQKAAARAEVDRLEAQLAAAKAKLRGTTPTTTKPPTDGPSAAEIRSWATSAGIECPTRGQIPAAVRAQYDHAHAA